MVLSLLFLSQVVHDHLVSLFFPAVVSGIPNHMIPIKRLAPSLWSINASPSQGGDGVVQHANTFQTFQQEKQGHKNRQYTTNSANKF